jgi:hypothetical protein
MLKTVSSITNAIGALNYKGTWDANANSPALASSVGTKGDYYVVGTAGSTNLNGISNWGVGDWAAFNGSVWQRVEGGADLNGVNLTVSGTTTLSGLTASTALALNASKEVVSVTNTGTGSNVLAVSPTLDPGSTDATTYNQVILKGGVATGNGIGYMKRQTTASVASSATDIFGVGSFGVLAIVTGVGGGAIFSDLLMVSYNGAAVISSNTQQGGPASRTYATASGFLRLTMGSATAMAITVQSLETGGTGA